MNGPFSMAMLNNQRVALKTAISKCGKSSLGAISMGYVLNSRVFAFDVFFFGERAKGG